MNTWLSLRSNLVTIKDRLRVSAGRLGDGIEAALLLVPSLILLLLIWLLLVSGALGLSLQVYLYLEDAKWYPFSLLDTATYNLEWKLADTMNLPQLASWREVHRVWDGGQALEAGLPPMYPLQLWLAHPQSWYGLHKITAGVLETFSVPFLLLVVGLSLWISRLLEP